MSEQRERFKKALAEDLQKAVTSQTGGTDTTAERWSVVAERIDLIVEAALIEHLKDRHK